jgi:hypothetical protein
MDKPLAVSHQPSASHGRDARTPRRRSLALPALAGTCVLLLAALGPGCASRRTDAFEALTSVPYQTEAWTFGPREGRRILTEHYDVYTTLDDERLLQALPQALETTYRFYRALVPAVGAPDARMRIYFFSNRYDWEYFTRRRFPRRAELLTRVRRGGYTQEGVAVIEYVSHQVTFPLAAHEGFHQFLHYCTTSKAPAWLNEGLAVICEGQRWTEVGLTAFDPWHNPTRRNTLAEALLRNELIPLDELLSTNAGRIVRGSARRTNTYYAQLWALILFLREGGEGKYAAGFDRMLRALGAGRLEAHARAAFVGSRQAQYNYGRALFEAFVAPDVEGVEREYVAFMRRRILNER